MSLPPEISDPISDFVAKNIHLIIIVLCCVIFAYVSFAILCKDAQILVKVRDSIEQIGINL